ncbi:tryptophan-rich sensory protein [Flavobacterium sp. CBA20B-1]|uniref:tryptophan-rich sensory protein n=1 Tax=unclassified Flavobacterium TaxID=196869 RepID=UPI0022253432|nr:MULTISPECIES: tryptophan-rich sensory protein [unclassified Flavobacterium]WCM41826.1 tryptophan-rich sensory protein [Flavobacterium sp. CBA20B-1]
MSKKVIIYLNFISLLATILVNYLLNTGTMNSNTMKSISDSYFNMFTPAGYAFSIWGIIYLLLIAHTIYSFYQLTKKNNSSIIDSIGLTFIATNVVNCLWVYFWLNDAILMCLILMIVLLILLLRILLNSQQLQPKIAVRNLFITCPFAIYVGWVSVALIANTAVWLTKIEWKPIFFTEVGWTILMLIIAGIIGVYISWKYNAIAFGVAVAWGVAAVAVSNFNENFNIVITAVIVCIAILSVCLYRLMHKIIPAD